MISWLTERQSFKAISLSVGLKPNGKRRFFVKHSAPVAIVLLGIYSPRKRFIPQAYYRGEPLLWINLFRDAHRQNILFVSS